MKLIGIITCPHCGSKEEKEIPRNSCIPFHLCKKCGKVVTAKKSCCVFCEFGDRKCPTAHG